MLQLDYPDDFVLGNGEFYTVSEFAEAAFKEIKIELKWIGSGLNEVGIFNDETMVKARKKFYRPLASDNYRADYSKVKKNQMGTKNQVQRLRKNNG